MYLFYITAYDNGTLPLPSNAAQTVVEINNLNDNIPVFSPTSYYSTFKH